MLTFPTPLIAATSFRFLLKSLNLLAMFTVYAPHLLKDFEALLGSFFSNFN